MFSGIVHDQSDDARALSVQGGAAGANSPACWGDWSDDPNAEPATCGTISIGTPPPPIPSADAPEAVGIRICEIACDADFEFYQVNGASLSATVSDIENVINLASWIFEEDSGVRLQITQIVVRTAEPDPYDATYPGPLLTQFRDEWLANYAATPRGVAALFTGRELDGPVVGIAYQSSACGAYAYCLTQSRFSADLGKRVCIACHEIGHTLGAQHCDGIDPSCRIMCSYVGYCSGGIHSFGPTQAGTIHAFSVGQLCLHPGSSDIAPLYPPFADDFSNCAAGDLDPTRWTEVDLVTCQSGRAEIAIGRGYDSHQRLGTMRTLPILIAGQLSFRLCQNTVPAGQSLTVECLDTRSFAWHVLRTIDSDGVPTTAYADYRIPFFGNAFGERLAIRFSATGSFATEPSAWFLDDVSITYFPGDYDADGDIDATDVMVLLACFGGPSTAPVGGCALTDVDGDGDVDLVDFAKLQSCFRGSGAWPGC
ncbi:MAG: M12 family metallo-peptidase [Phycisphaerae bacterium]